MDSFSKRTNPWYNPDMKEQIIAAADTNTRLKGILQMIPQPLRYVFVSLIVYACDNALFFVLHNYILYGNESIAYVLGRLFGASVGYLLNRRYVFRYVGKNKADDVKSLTKYAILACANTAIGLALMLNVLTIPHFFPFLAKQVADLILYVFNFLIQREIIFKRRTTNKDLKRPSDTAS
jgi:putative flippase GtrA